MEYWIEANKETNEKIYFETNVCSGVVYLFGLWMEKLVKTIYSNQISFIIDKTLFCFNWWNIRRKIMIIFSEIIDIKHQHPLNKIKYVWGNLNFMQVFQVTAPVQIVKNLI